MFKAIMSICGIILKKQ